MSTGTHPPEHLKITFSGTLGDPPPGVEIWSFGVNARVAGFTDVASLQALANACQSSYTGFAAITIGQEARLTRTRVASVGPDGLVRRTAAGAYSQADSLVVQGGLSQGTGRNYAVSLAVSLQSAFPGPTGRGRLYLPLPGLGPLTNGVMQAGDQGTMLSRMRAFLNDLNDKLATAGHGPIVVASGGSVVKGLAPALHNVTTVRVGQVPDTMRSRRNALPEQYASTALGPG